MTARQVDALLDERARLVVQRGAAQGHLWAAEFLLRRVEKLLPHLIADGAHNAVARDTIAEEIREFLTEPREHGVQDPFSLDAAAGSNAFQKGNIEREGTTLPEELTS